MNRGKLFNETPTALPVRQDSVPLIVRGHCNSSLAHTFCHPHYALAPPTHCLNTVICELQKSHAVSANLMVSFCPSYYLKRSTVPFTQAFLQQIYKVTNICFRNRCLCQNSLLLINAFPVNI